MHYRSSRAEPNDKTQVQVPDVSRRNEPFTVNVALCEDKNVKFTAKRLVKPDATTRVEWKSGGTKVQIKYAPSIKGFLINFIVHAFYMRFGKEGGGGGSVKPKENTGIRTNTGINRSTIDARNAKKK